MKSCRELKKLQLSTREGRVTPPASKISVKISVRSKVHPTSAVLNEALTNSRERVAPFSVRESKVTVVPIHPAVGAGAALTSSAGATA